MGVLFSYNLHSEISDLTKSVSYDRYQRGNRSLMDNLQKGGSGPTTMNKGQDEEEEEEYDIPEELEDVIGMEGKTYYWRM